MFVNELMVDGEHLHLISSRCVQYGW